MASKSSSSMSTGRSKQHVATNSTEPTTAELSQEDRQFQRELEQTIRRLQESVKDQDLCKVLLETLRELILVSMAAIPRLGESLQPIYATLKDCHSTMAEEQYNIPYETRNLCSDIISVLGMTLSKERDCLHYSTGAFDDNFIWGGDYIRHLLRELTDEWAVRNDLRTMLFAETKHIVSYCLEYGLEAKVDLGRRLISIGCVGLLEPFADLESYSRLGRHLESCVTGVPYLDKKLVLVIAREMYMKFNDYAEALHVTMQLYDRDRMIDIFQLCDRPAVRKQMALSMGLQRLALPNSMRAEGVSDLNKLASNAYLSSHFLWAVRELGIDEPKTPADVYQDVLDRLRPHFKSGVGPLRESLASTLVNGFVNAAFLSDKIVQGDSDRWMCKDNDYSMMCAIASVGLIHMWSADDGLTHIDKYLNSDNCFIRAGALIAYGMIYTGVCNHSDPDLFPLSNGAVHKNVIIRLGSILGLGIAYAGSNNIKPINQIAAGFVNLHRHVDLFCVASLALGLIGLSSQNESITAVVFGTLLTHKSVRPLDNDAYTHLLPLCLGLLNFGLREKCDKVLDQLSMVFGPLRTVSLLIVECCAYAGSADVAVMRKLFRILAEHVEPNHVKIDEPYWLVGEGQVKELPKNTYGATDPDRSKAKDGGEAAGGDGAPGSYATQTDDLSESIKKVRAVEQSTAVLGLALVAIGDDAATEKVFRLFDTLVRCKEPRIRSAIALALGILSASNPAIHVVETLMLLCARDRDPGVIHSAIFGLGLAGAGTKAAGVECMIQSLAHEKSKNADGLCMVNFALGLVHMGKGALTLSPLNTKRQLAKPVALASLLATAIIMLTMKNTLLGRAPHLLYCLAPAIHPRTLITLDGDLKPLSLPVLLTQVPSQTGEHRMVIESTTATTPLLLPTDQQAEIDTLEYMPLTRTIEGCVVMRRTRWRTPYSDYN